MLTRLRNESEPPKPENKDEKPTEQEKPSDSGKNDESEKHAESNGKQHTDPSSEDKPETEKSSVEDAKKDTNDQKDTSEKNGDAAEDGAKKNGDDTQAEPKKDDDDSKVQQEKSTANGDDAVEESARDGQVPSSILEKGILYFVYRGRVNIDDPKEVQDIARSYLVLRPLPHGAKLGDGPIGDDKNCRLIAIPKKTLPVSGNDKWTAFVEKANASFKELKDGFLTSNEYETTTQGSQHTPAVTPAAEGVYAITTTGRETHLAYIVTLPTSLGEVQHDLGIREKGSFITSVKNPKASGPASADLGQDPGFSTELQNEFRSLRWAPLKPDHLNYESCQFLMIGEGENGLEKATEPQQEDTKNDKDEPKAELEKLEGEDEMRVEHLKGKLNYGSVFVPMVC